MDLSVRFWSASIEELVQGYVYDPEAETYYCLVCGKEYPRGVIYQEQGVLLEAKRAAQNHISTEHGSMFDFLINMGKQYTGLTDLQRELLISFHRGLSDREVAQELGIGSTSTVRNHRFKLREKEKQAKVFQALMACFSEEKPEIQDLVEIHRGAKMIDERYVMTQAEKEKYLNKYFADGGQGELLTMPSKEKRKLAILQHIASRFQPGRKYTELEVNQVLRAVYGDYVLLRRYLIEYGFMERTTDCSEYWVKLQ